MPIVVLFLSPAEPAKAQRAQAQETISQAVRGRGASDDPTESFASSRTAKAMRVGNLFVMPRATFRASYDDNIDATETDQRDDIILSSDVGVRVQSNLRRHQFGAELVAGHRQFVKNSAESDPRIALQGDGQLHFTRQSGAVGLITYVQDRENREAAAASEDSEDGRFHDLRAIAQYEQKFSRLSWSTGLDIERVEFEADEAGDRDRTDVTADVELAFDLTRKTKLVVSPSLSRLSFDRTDDRTGFDNDETRYAILTGLEVTYDETLYGEIGTGYAFEFSDDPIEGDSGGAVLEAGLEYKPNKRLDLSLQAGFDGAADSGLEDGDSTAFTFLGQMNYRFGSRTSIGVVALRRLGETDVTGADIEIKNELQARFSRSLTKDMKLTFAGSISRSDFDGIDRIDDEVVARVAYDYALTDRLSFDVSYRFSKRTSDADDRNFTRNLASVGLVVQF